MRGRIFEVIAVLALAGVFLAGCWDMRTIENMHTVIAMGIDRADRDILLSFFAPVVEPDAEEKNIRVATLGSTIRDAEQNFIKILSKEVIFDKVQTVVLGESAAREGVMKYIREFDRYRTIPLTAHMVVSPLGAWNILNLEMKDKPRIGIYIEKLIASAAKNSMAPRVGIIDFINSYYDGGKDPYLPVVCYGPGKAEEIKISSVALFTDDRQAGIIEDDEVIFFMMLLNKAHIAKFTVFLGGDEGKKDFVSLSCKNTKTRITPEYRGGRFIFHFSVGMDAWINEYVGDLDLEKEVEKLEKKISKYMHERIVALLYKLQAINSDAVGLGQYVRAKMPKRWNRNRWREDYLKAEFTVEARVNITQYGNVK